MGLKDKLQVGKVVEDINFKQKAWPVLIAYGGVVDIDASVRQSYRYRSNESAVTAESYLAEEKYKGQLNTPADLLDDCWSYYSGRPSRMPPELSIDALEAIREHGVDWDKTSEPAETTQREFAGTFVDYDSPVECLFGVLYTNDGRAWLWWTHANGHSLSSLLKLVIGNKVTLEDALEDFEERLTSTENYHWDYTLEVRL